MDSIRAATLAAFAVAATLGLCAGAAHASPGARLTLPARVLHAGEVVELRWESLPAGVEELEILLSLDGGRHYGVRVSPECDPLAGRYLWRVPNLASGTARLRLRIGLDGRELDAATSESFSIVGRADAAPEFDQFHENGWWAGPAPPAAGAPASLDPGGEAYEISREAGAPAVPPRDDAALEPVAIRVAGRPPAPGVAPPKPPRVMPTPRPSPLRL
jgi:hypothetical protein